MKTESDEYKTTGMDMVVKYFGAIMALAYIGIGVAMISQSTASFNIPRMYATPLGILLVVYGVFRGYKIYQRYFQK